jgi:hemolysin activation/secretion protein
MQNNVFISLLYRLLAITLLLLSSNVLANTFTIESFRLDGFKDEPAYGIKILEIKQQLNSGLKQFNGQLSLQQAHNIADYLTQIYKHAGLIFHRVIVPAQEIKNNTLHLKLIAGKLANISIKGNKDYSSKRIGMLFYDVLHKPADKESIEQALLLLNDYPGLTVFGYFSRGREQGNTRINLKVQKENIFEGSIRMDNYGVDSTGENRLFGQFSFNNAFGRADQISIGLLGSENNLYGSLAYNMPLWNAKNHLNILLSNNQFDLAGDFSSLGVKGDAQIIRADLEHVLLRSYKYNFKIDAYIDSKQSELEDENGSAFLNNEEKTTGMGFGTLMDFDTDFGRYRFHMNLYSGGYDDGFGALNDKGFSTSNLIINSQFVLAKNKPYFHSNLSLMYRGQFTGDILPGYEKFTLSGAYAVRALSSGVASTDAGQLISINWRLLNPHWLGDNKISKNIRPGLFIDWAKGENTSALNEKEKASGYGVVVDYLLGGHLSGRFFYAKSIDINIQSFGEEESSHAYAELVYQF